MNYFKKKIKVDYSITIGQLLFKCVLGSLLLTIGLCYLFLMENGAFTDLILFMQENNHSFASIVLVFWPILLIVVTCCEVAGILMYKTDKK